MALLVVPLVTLSASPQDKSAISANGPDVRAALPSAAEAADAALAATKEKAAIEAARFAPQSAAPAIPRKAPPAAPNGDNPIIVTATAGTVGTHILSDSR